MKQIVLWFAAIAAAACLLVATNYQSRDPDSALYARLSGELAKAPPGQWIAPQWGGAWNQQGLFREHPIGILILPVILIKAGFPAEQASYAVNMLYQAAVLLLIPLVARAIANHVEAATLPWLLQLLPVSFAYRIRANQEHAVLMCLLAMLYGAHRARTKPAWLVLLIVPFCFMVLIKGAFAMFGLVAVALWLVLVPAPPGGTNRWPWIGVALTLVAATLMMAGYEMLYRQTTGDSFLAFYRSSRLGESMRLSDPAVVPHAILNVGWYLARLVWFAAPWSLFAGGALWVWARSRMHGRAPTFDPISERGLLWSFLVTAVYIAVLSPALVRAERFIFPTYFIIGSVGIITALRASDWARRVAIRAEAHSWLSVSVWGLTFLLSLVARIARVAR